MFYWLLNPLIKPIPSNTLFWNNSNYGNSKKKKEKTPLKKNNDSQIKDKN